MPKGMPRLFVFALCASLLLIGSTVSADVYKYRDAHGRIYLTDKPMRGGGYRLLKRFRMSGTGDYRGETVSAPSTWKGLRERKKRYAPMIQQVANKHQLRPELVDAVVRAESAYRSDAVSKKGAMGLMQLMPATAKRFGVNDAYDPKQNLTGGSRYLKKLLKLFNYDLRLALAAYNAGENAVIKYGHQIPPYPETQNYVKKVLRFYNENRSRDKLAQS